MQGGKGRRRKGTATVAPSKKAIEQHLKRRKRKEKGDLGCGRLFAPSTTCRRGKLAPDRNREEERGARLGPVGGKKKRKGRARLLTLFIDPGGKEEPDADRKEKEKEPLNLFFFLRGAYGIMRKGGGGKGKEREMTAGSHNFKSFNMSRGGKERA